MIEPFWKALWQYLLKLNVYITYEPAIPLSEGALNVNAYICAPREGKEMFTADYV